MTRWSIKKDDKSLWFYTPWFFFNFYFPSRISSYRCDRHDVLSDFHFDLTFARIHFEFSLRDDEQASEFADRACNLLQNVLDPEFEQNLIELDQFCKNASSKKSDQSC
jgi:hypothetical protein